MSLLHEKPASELLRLIRGREISPLELMEALLRRAEEVNPRIHAFATLHPEEALKQARAVTESLAAGRDPGPLAGLPIGVKDLEDAEGMVTSYGSVPYKDNVAARDSVQVARLKRAGAIVLGKTNVPEFGFTGFTKNRVYGVTGNPWDPERTAGGSSGGSAAAVAGGLAPMATGSDAGGSIRIPACYCGCYGLKPSAGRIPVGPTPLLPPQPLMVLGPLTRTVEDAALYLDCTAGSHPCDPSSLPPPMASFLANLDQLPRNMKIAFSPTLGHARVQRDVMARVEEAVRVFEELGHRVEVWQGAIPDPAEAWSTLMNTELYGVLADDLERHRSELGHTLVMALEHARTLTTADFLRANRMRSELNRILWDLFEAYDLLLTPTMPTEAFGAKGPPPGAIEGHPIPLLGAVAFTYPFNLSGHPAATVPAGLSRSGLPTGLQIVGPRLRDDLVLQASRAFEKARPWPLTAP